jgi:hypothetical protein
MTPWVRSEKCMEDDLNNETNSMAVQRGNDIVIKIVHDAALSLAAIIRLNAWSCGPRQNRYNHMAKLVVWKPNTQFRIIELAECVQSAEYIRRNVTQNHFFAAFLSVSSYTGITAQLTRKTTADGCQWQYLTQLSDFIVSNIKRHSKLILNGRQSNLFNW